MKCLEHLDYVGTICPDCKLEVDFYGNTEECFDNCSFPDCGCDGSRLCMAKNGPNEDSMKGNIEGMWNTKKKTKKQLKGMGHLLNIVNKK
jgi:hypothetical protein